MKSNVFCLNRLFCLLAALFVALTVSVVHATDYTINGPVGPNNYVSLEALRNAGITWQNNDTITLDGNDDTLTAAFDFGSGNNVTIQGSGTIKPSGNGIRFANSGNITIDSGTGVLLFDGFNTTGSGGAISGTSVTFSGGINSFSGNTATNNGGAIYAIANAILIADVGDITFQGNKANGSSNAIHMENGGGGKTLP